GAPGAGRTRARRRAAAPQPAHGDRRRLGRGRRRLRGRRAPAAAARPDRRRLPRRRPGRPQPPAHDRGAAQARHRGGATAHARQRVFSERLQPIMTKYVNSNLTSAEVIAALVEMAKEVAAEESRGQRFEPPLNRDELAFYDAVATNESAVDVQGEDVLAQIA